MEFGSDFHTFDYPKGGKSLLENFPESNLYASGRQALLALAIARDWKRLWIPSYFCEDTLNSICRCGIELCKYKISPKNKPDDLIKNIPVKDSDGLLVVNYFGVFENRDLSNVHCEIVEDHTHNLIGDWALNSHSDWCIASLRKTLPIADGGMLWSPKHHDLPIKPIKDTAVEAVMSRRYNAMNLKHEYLNGLIIDKEEYLKLYSDTEEEFDRLPISLISKASFQIVNNLDIKFWYDVKYRNWKFLYENLKDVKSVNILKPENHTDCPFSLILIFQNGEKRNKVRSSLISRSVYPAILWTIKDETDARAQVFGDRMLSIHCDGRYSLNDMSKLLSMIKESLT